MKKFIWEELPPRIDGGRSYQRFILRIRGNMEFEVFENYDHTWSVKLRFYLHNGQYVNGASTDGLVSIRRVDDFKEAMTWCEQWLASLIPQIADVTYQTSREVWYR